MVITTIKNGLELSGSERKQIQYSLLREFNVPFPTREQLTNKTFFLLKEGNEILSMGAMLLTYPVVFKNQNFKIYGFVNIISNIKSKGYGKTVVAMMKKFLSDKNASGIGFCKPSNQGFYERCGLTIDTTSTQRFVYLKGDKRITNQDGQYIFYQDSTDNFMNKVIADRTSDVYIPFADLW